MEEIGKRGIIIGEIRENRKNGPRWKKKGLTNEKTLIYFFDANEEYGFRTLHDCVPL